MTDGRQHAVIGDGYAAEVSDDARHVGTAEIGHFVGCPADVAERVDGVRRHGRDWLARSRPIGVAVDQCAGNGGFEFRLFSERYADGVADAVFEQRADAQSRLDPSVFGLARFRHAEVQRIRFQSFLIQPLHQQPVRLHHHLRITRLHRQYNVVILLVFADAQKLQCRLHHPNGRITVATQNAVGQRPVIGADAHSRAVFFADAHQRQKLRPNPF